MMEWLVRVSSASQSLARGVQKAHRRFNFGKKSTSII
jgi:hypothetical protein